MYRHAQFGLYMDKKKKCDTATLKVVEVRRGLL